MTEQGTFFNRIGGWFKRGQVEAATPAAGDSTNSEPITSAAPKVDASVPVVTGSIERSTFLRPWTRRDATVEQLQTGMLAMSEVMGTIRNNLERQSKRQDEMIEYLLLLPQLIQQIPANARSQREAITSIQRQLEKQDVQNAQVARVLDRISKADGEQRRALEAVQDRVEWINRNEHGLTQSLSNVGLLLQNMSRDGDVSNQVLRQIRDTLTSRENKLFLAFKRQSRLNLLLLSGLLTTVTALTATGMLGLFGFNILSYFVK
jgi:hypothetical protein